MNNKKLNSAIYPSLKNRIVLITGGASGIGESIVEHFCNQQAKVIFFDIDNKSLTHRPDLWGHYGFAREFAAIFDLPLKPYPGLKVESKGGTGFNVAVNSENCRRYSALRVKNITVGESPE